jgi:hypothetical protein
MAALDGIDEFGIDPQLSVSERLGNLEQAHRTTLKERARIIRLQRSQLRGVLVLSLVLVVAGFFFGKHLEANSNHIGHAQNLAAAALGRSNARHEALRAYQIHACERSNETRAGENRSHRDDYLFDTHLVKLLDVALAEPAAPQPNLSPRQVAENRKLTIAFTSQLAGYAADKEWRHLIPDCEYAVDNPQTYKLPRPIRFSVQMAPADALTVQKPFPPHVSLPHF